MGVRHKIVDRKSAHASCPSARPIAGIAALASLAAVLFSPGVGAAEPEKSAPPEWLGVLSLQLKSEYHCDLDKLLFHREVPVGDQISTEGRARCIDAREVDFTRNNKHEKFTLRLCMPTVC